MKKRTLAFLLVMILIVSLLPPSVLAAETKPAGGEMEIYVNPLYQDVVTEQEIADHVAAVLAAKRNLLKSVRRGSMEYLTLEEAGEAYREAFQNRTDDIMLYMALEGVYAQNELSGLALAAQIKELAFAYTGKGDEGDYLEYHENGYGAGCTYLDDDGEYTFVMLEIIPDYHTTLAQEEAVDAALALVRFDTADVITTSPADIETEAL